MITSWEDYLNPQLDAGTSRDRYRQFRSAFASQRAGIQRVFDARRPDVVACLGAGMLSDIPYQRFVEADATVHLVDWLPGVTERGIAHSIIRRVEAGTPQCAYCRLTGGDPQAYCSSYRQTQASRSEVCDAFEASPDDPDVCLAFRKNKLPYVHRQDVTGGYASAFGAAVADDLRGVTSWRQAFKRATALATRVVRRQSRLAIDDGTVDLVLSSMVMSQFEHEPYDYFSRQCAALIGPPTAPEEKRLRPAMQNLRSILLRNQIKGHCEEIDRILAPTGRCFLAVEMFVCEKGDDRWFLLNDMHGALAALAQRFDFDIDAVPDLIADSRFETRGSRSVVYQLLLVPKLA